MLHSRRSEVRILRGPGYGRNDSQLEKYSFVPMQSRRKLSLEMAPVSKPKLMTLAPDQGERIDGLS